MVNIPPGQITVAYKAGHTGLAHYFDVILVTPNFSIMNYKSLRSNISAELSHNLAEVYLQRPIRLAHPNWVLAQTSIMTGCHSGRWGFRSPRLMANIGEP